tara:strand:- start:56 stop:541 length:486 start_codon:yes stop_codon:yes gene_type:complete
MIHCRACRAEISENAKSCVQCGEPEPSEAKFQERKDAERKRKDAENVQENAWAAAILGFLLFLIVGATGIIPYWVSLPAAFAFYFIAWMWQEAESPTDFFVRCTLYVLFLASGAFSVWLCSLFGFGESWVVVFAFIFGGAAGALILTYVIGAILFAFQKKE